MVAMVTPSDELNAQLKSFGFDSAQLAIADQPPLIIQAIVRVLPHKRLVCKASWGDQAVYVKLFVGRGALRYATRDAEGIATLHAAGILAPKCLLRQSISHAALLIYAAIAPAQNAEAMWPALSDAARFRLATRLVTTLAQHHNARLMQSDLYLKNFLVQDDHIYTLDGDGIRQLGCFAARQALANLAVLLSKLDVLEVERWLPALVTTYQQVRGVALPSLTHLDRMIAHQRRLNASRYADHKVFRQCTDVQLSHNHYFFALNRAYTSLALPQQATALDQLMAEGDLLKAGRTCTVARVSLQGVEIAIKRYNIKDFWHGLGRLLRLTRASVSWANAHRMRLLALPTASPVALLELRRWRVLRGKAYFLSAYLDAPDIKAFLAASTNPSLQLDLATQVATLFYRLYLLQLSHGDMKASNIKVYQGEPVLIDLDSMRQHRLRYFSKKAHVRDLRRFMQNWQEVPALYNTFISAFQDVYKDHSPLAMADFHLI